MNDFVTNLLNLPNTNVLSYQIKNDVVYIHIESTETTLPCRNRGRETKPKGLGQEVTLRRLPMEALQFWSIMLRFYKYHSLHSSNPSISSFISNSTCSAIAKMKPDQRKIIKELIDGMIIKYKTQRWQIQSNE